MTGVGLKQQFISHIKNNEIQDFREIGRYEHKVLFLTNIEPDPDNARHLPACIISDADAEAFIARKLSKQQLREKYQAEGRVLMGKSCFVNCIERGSVGWTQANKNIESILALAENIAVSEVLQNPTIYPIDDGRYRINTGHRRFFAMLFALGSGGAAQFKVYKVQPLLTKVKQFQENASRVDLPQYGKLKAFLMAKSELDTFSEAKRVLGQPVLTVREIASLMGISMGAFDNYNVLSRYNAVLDAFENGLSIPFTRVKKMVLAEEKLVREREELTRFNIEHKREINQKLKDILSNNKTKAVAKPVTYRVPNLTSEQALKTLLFSDVRTLNTSINWQETDWVDPKAVSKLLETLVTSLTDAQDN